MHDHDATSVYTTVVLAGPICAILGVNWGDALRRAGLHHVEASDRALLVSAAESMALWRAMIALSDGTATARVLGERVASGPAIPLLFAMSTAPNFAVGLRRLARYKHIFGPMRLAVSQDQDAVNIGIVPDVAHVSLPDSFSSPFAIYLHAKAKAMAARPFPARAVSLPLPQDERAELVDLFGVMPTFGPAALTYAAEHMESPFISPNEELWAATEVDLKSQALIASGHAMTSHRVRATLLESFGATTPSLEHVCQRLKVSKSTLFRRLRAEGTSFQAVLNATRIDLAGRYLRTSDLSNQQIAHLLGYRDPASFQRAFRKWTGKTPQQHRRAAIGLT